MLRPSYSELMDLLNEDADIDNKITSRYTIVIAAAKRARQIINGSPCDKSGAKTDKAVSIAVSEMSRGLIKILPEGISEDETLEGQEQAAEAISSEAKLIAENFKNADTTFDDSIFDDDEFDEQFTDDGGYSDSLDDKEDKKFRDDYEEESY